MIFSLYLDSFWPRNEFIGNFNEIYCKTWWKTVSLFFLGHTVHFKDTPLSLLFSTVFAIELWNFHKLSDSGKNEFLPKKIGDSVTNFHSIANFTGLPGLYATAYSSYSFWATWLKLHIYVPRHTVKIFYWGLFDILPVSISIPNYNIYIEKSKK